MKMGQCRKTKPRKCITRKHTRPSKRFHSFMLEICALKISIQINTRTEKKNKQKQTGVFTRNTRILNDIDECRRIQKKNKKFNTR